MSLSFTAQLPSGGRERVCVFITAGPITKLVCVCYCRSTCVCLLLIITCVQMCIRLCVYQMCHGVYYQIVSVCVSVTVSKVFEKAIFFFDQATGCPAFLPWSRGFKRRTRSVNAGNRQLRPGTDARFYSAWVVRADPYFLGLD